MEDGHSPWSLAVFVVFIIIDAIFYGFGAALQSLNEKKLEKAAEEGDKKAEKLLHMIDNPAKFINMNQIAANVVGIVTGGYILGRVREYILYLMYQKMAYQAAVWIKLVTVVVAAMVLLLLLLSFGIIIPKKCASRKPERWAYKLLPAVASATILMYPFTMLVTGISNIFLRLIGIDPNAPDDNVTEEEIMSMVNEGHEQGVLLASEAEMITNIFEFGDKEAADIMTHRKNVIAIDGATTLRSTVEFILDESYSRFPVYEKDLDDIIGLLYLKDAMIYAEKEEDLDKPIREIEGLLREAHFIPETRNINLLFKEMQSRKIHVEIVVDEYGQTAGIVTMEDILEEIVGNILDEYDEDEHFIQAVDENTWIMEGMTPLEDVSDVLGIDFEEEEYDTLNGFLISLLDRIPQEDEELVGEYENYRFVILSVENKMIQSVKVERVEISEASNEPEEKDGDRK